MGTRSGVTSRGGVGVARPPPAVLKTVRPKLFRRASLTSWGKDNLGMTRAAASVNLKELMLTVQQQKVIRRCFFICSVLELSFSYCDRFLRADSVQFCLPQLWLNACVLNTQAE